jgi:hypothetical protein
MKRRWSVNILTIILLLICADGFLWANDDMPLLPFDTVLIDFTDGWRYAPSDVPQRYRSAQLLVISDSGAAVMWRGYVMEGTSTKAPYVSLSEGDDYSVQLGSWQRDSDSKHINFKLTRVDNNYKSHDQAAWESSFMINGMHLFNEDETFEPVIQRFPGKTDFLESQFLRIVCNYAVDSKLSIGYCRNFQKQSSD